jgi:hypothetical protein
MVGQIMISLKLVKALNKKDFNKSEFEPTFFGVADWLEKEYKLNDCNIYKIPYGYHCVIEGYRDDGVGLEPLTKQSFIKKGKTRQQAFENAVLKVLGVE